MTTALTAPPEASPPEAEPTEAADAATNVAELIERLGGVPAGRILLDPPPGTATEADLLRRAHAPERRLCELVEGTLVEKPMSHEESVLAAWLCHLVHAGVRVRPLGKLSTEGGSLRLAGRLVRRPDVAFTPHDRLPPRGQRPPPIPDAAPTFAVEILSDSNTEGEMDRKRREYFAAGTRLVWLVQWRDRSVTVYRHPGRPDAGERIDDPSATLDGGDALPGFAVTLAEVFACLDEDDAPSDTGLENAS